MNQIKGDIPIAIPDDEDTRALEKALSIQLPPEKLLRLTQTHPPDPSWFQEELERQESERDKNA